MLQAGKKERRNSAIDEEEGEVLVRCEEGREEEET